MDVAVVTGASSGLGLAISNKLLSLGFKVYGLGGNYSDASLQNSGFIPINCDLADPAMVEHMAGEILKKETAISVLINNAKLYPAESFDKGAGGEFALCLNINLLCPLILARRFLPGLQNVQGKVITISPATPETTRGGPMGAATAGGLRWMQEALFQEYRDTGVSFSTISPEPNRWRPADSPKPQNSSAKSAIDPEAVSDAIAQIVLNTTGNLITEVVIRPERLTESGIPAMREVPYPKPQPIPYTVPRELIEAEEMAELQEEELEFEPKRRSSKKRNRKNKTEDEESSEDDSSSTPKESNREDTEGDEKPSRKRRRRRGRRRGRGGEDNNDSPREEGNERAKKDPSSSSETDSSHQTAAKPTATKPPSPEQGNAGAVSGEGPSDKPARRRRRGRKPRPMDGAEKPGFFEPSDGTSVKEAKPADKVQTEAPLAKPAEKPVPKEATPKPVKKTAKKVAKKSTKKAAKKATAKKSTATKKKTAKKAAAKKSAKKAVKKAVRKKVAQKSIDKTSD